ncbi:LysE family translocator [Pseudohongiella nitratireducens]|uniref:LysE family translocator n=1 Tax=Pseudohongiella nitratireducens TaxID=1768907 RepID=UPI0009ED5976|nr:LysE family translocator [Pseudohongiella nitratireducens]
MDNYLIYVGVAIATILLPGPAVMLTINNSIQRGLFKSLSGIFGIALAILLVAVISATSLGIILASSIMAFTVVKIIGAVYLIYLGIKMWRTKEASGARSSLREVSFLKCFIEGFLVSISNPKGIIFFMSIFPQFIDLSQEYNSQFILLAVTFSVLVIVIHTAYALFSSFARSKLSSSRGSVALNKVSGVVFVSFGIGLASSSR